MPKPEWGSKSTCIAKLLRMEGTSRKCPCLKCRKKAGKKDGAGDSRLPLDRGGVPGNKETNEERGE
jgi:hypothetical protein